MAEAADKKSAYKKTFKMMEKNMKNFVEQIDAPLPDERTLENFDVESFWTELAKVCDKLSFEANKLSLSWLSPPPPSNKDVIQMGACLELACVALLAAYHNFPSDAGLNFRKHFREKVATTLDACQTFVKTLATTIGKKYASNTHPILQSFGAISNSCESIKNMPRSNKVICIQRLTEEHNLLKDALNELDEVSSEDFVDDFVEITEKWTEKDLHIINPSKGLIKTSIVLTKKTMTTIKSIGLDNKSEHLLEYDKVLELFSKMSSTVDEVALTLYPPISWAETKSTNEILKDYLESVLEELSKCHFMKCDESNKWKDFIGKAIVHNFSEIQRVLITNGLAEMKV